MSTLSLRQRALWRARRATRGSIRRLRNAGRSFRPLFVTGAMGGGNTLLAYRLSQEFACAGLAMEGANHVGSFLRVPHTDRFASIRAYQRFLGPKPEWSVRRGREALLALYRSLAEEPREVMIDKGPNAMMVRADFYGQCFPEGRFVMIFRDPVVNLEGFRRKWRTFANDSLAENVRFYREIHEAYLAFADAHPERAKIVEYERLVADPKALLEHVATWAGLQRTDRGVAIDLPGSVLRDPEAEVSLMQRAAQRALAAFSADEIALIRKRLDPIHAQLRDRAEP